MSATTQTPPKGQTNQAILSRFVFMTSWSPEPTEKWRSFSRRLQDTKTTNLLRGMTNDDKLCTWGVAVDISNVTWQYGTFSACSTMKKSLSMSSHGACVSRQRWSVARSCTDTRPPRARAPTCRDRPAWWRSWSACSCRPPRDPCTGHPGDHAPP